MCAKSFQLSALYCILLLLCFYPLILLDFQEYSPFSSSLHIFILTTLPNISYPWKRSNRLASEYEVTSAVWLSQNCSLPWSFISTAPFSRQSSTCAICCDSLEILCYLLPTALPPCSTFFTEDRQSLCFILKAFDLNTTG